MSDPFKKRHRTWNKIRRTVRRPFESAGYIFLMWTVPLLPRRLLLGFARLAGWLALILPIRERTVAFTNLNTVFGDTKTDAEKKEIFVTSIATFVLTMLDVFWFSFRAEQRINKYVKFEDTPIVDSFFEDKAIICITAHMGSWELIGQTAALRGADLASIAATIKNQTVNRILIKKREKTGQTIIPRQGALKTLISRLRKKGKTAFVLDQNTHPKNGGIWVDFLGMPMSVSPAPAALAYRTGTPIYFGFSLPEPGGHYRMIVPKIIEPPVFDKQADMDAVVHQLTQDIEDVISEKIRDYPQFWLWSYRHWQRHAGHDFPPNYPSY